MKIVNDSVPIDEGTAVALSKMTIEYTADLDCCQSEKEYPEGVQTLTVETDDGGGGKFLRIHTGKAGWSINNTTELIDVLNDFNSRLNLNFEK